MAKEKATPTGPHTPVSNLVTETEALRGKLISTPEAGGAPGVLDPRENGTEELWPEVRPELSAGAPQAPSTEGLADIGTASFGQPGVQLETVHGIDDRVLVSETDKYPWRINASLLITARDGSQWIGTAWFISPRTLVTAGHCVFIKGSGVPGRDGWVKSIQVMPGRDGSDLPYGSATSMQFFTVQGWANGGDENYDYGAIIIPTELGKSVGTIGFTARNDAELASAIVNVAGYPGDKPSGTMWYDTKQVATTTPTKVHYDIDTAGGQSGAAVYVIDGNDRLAVAVHAYGGPTTNSGTRISASVFRNLSNWKA